MKRRTFLKGLFAVTVPLPAIVKLGTVKQNYDFTLTKIEVKRSEIQFSLLVRGMATLDNSPDGKEHSCYFAYEILDVEGMPVENSFHKAKPMIRNYFINKFTKPGLNTPFPGTGDVLA